MMAAPQRALAPPTPSSIPDWMRFPVNAVIGDPRFQRIAGKAIWLVVPLEYYVLTSFNGGIALDSYVPAAAMALTCVLAVAFTAALLAWAYRNPLDYRNRVHGITVALLSIWATAILLIATSYFATSMAGAPRDVLADFLCSRWPCVNHPRIIWQTLLAYFGYSLAAAFICSGAIRAIALRLGPIPPAATGVPAAEKVMEPDVATCAVVVSLLMTFLHRASTVDSFF